MISSLLKKIAHLIRRNYHEQTILFLYRHTREKKTIVKDLLRWQIILSLPGDKHKPTDTLLRLFHQKEEYRNLFYYRLQKDPITSHFVYRLARQLFPPKSHLEIHAQEGIGPGLFIQHGRATGIVARRIGQNCWINQLVSIGYKDRNSRPPVLGNNVFVFAGAKVYGDITIGDNVVIGANAVVTKDVPPNCTVGGVPARIIKRNGRRVDERL